jgi:hypothetical protein
LPDTFTDYKGVTKYWNPIVNAPKNVEVPKKMKDQGSDQRGGGGGEEEPNKILFKNRPIS